MKKSLMVAAFLSLMLTGAKVMALDLAVKVGVCDKSSDYCPTLPGRVVLGHDLIEDQGHVIRVEVEHTSGIEQSDYGTNMMWVGYKYTFGK